MNNLWKKKSASTPAPQIRKVYIPDDPKSKPAPLQSKIRENQALAQRQRDASAGLSRNHSSPSTSKDPTRLQVRTKRKALRQKSPSTQHFSDDDDDDDDNDANGDEVSSPAASEKRQRRENSGPVDLKRKLRSRKAFSEEEGTSFAMIHAADVISDERKAKLGGSKDLGDDIIVELKYPNASQRERFKLVTARDEIDAYEEIIKIAEIVTDVYLTPEQAKPFKDQNGGYIRRLERARNMKQPQDFKEAVKSYNAAIDNLNKGGILAENLDSKHHMPLVMVQRILGQVYDRVVSPKVESLRKYENGSDNVYGELLPSFVHDLLTEVGLKSDQVFVDLGSGVGNVVFQAALEFGCESWGCEMMQNAYELADAQKKEFGARCRLWGVAPGRVHLQGANFLESKPIHEAMKQADVILVNNHVFTPQTNRSLVDMFLDLKDGCKIISMKNFVPDDHVAKRNADDPVNILDIIKKGHYYAGSVSWTDDPERYYIAKKRSFAEAE
ncbi:hypothetical protein BP6252_00542 [Coleophoma cylindrospora]|uniref:Histone-lysine N-methyltransferase, H3 lysine-79 specific n=1 Tax=Coleophoma cylindrospora TaxID=1849047 RepID=A0A3D8SQB4_9HELO|nr:hypothetical protein BP6252_00542 [Coleophoma cylindrospora]